MNIVNMAILDLIGMGILLVIVFVLTYGEE